MEPVGNQNFWKPESPDGEPTQSQYAGYDLQDDQTPMTPVAELQSLQWQASEYIHHEKNAGWFLALIAGSVVLSALAFFLIRSWTFTALVAVMAVALVVFARRPPRIINYSLGPEGLQMNEQHYAYQDFRAFGVVQEESVYSISLIPVKRFKPSVTVYFPPENGEQVVDILGSQLPMEQIELDAVDKIVRKLRF